MTPSPRQETDLLDWQNLLVSALKQVSSRVDQLAALVTDEREFLDKLQALGGPWLLHDQRLAALEVAVEHLRADRPAIRALLDRLAESNPDYPMQP